MDGLLAYVVTLITLLHFEKNILHLFHVSTVRGSKAGNIIVGTHRVPFNASNQTGFKCLFYILYMKIYVSIVDLVLRM